jgi:hypothetical protein
MSSNISQHQEKATVSSILVTAPSRRRFLIFTMRISRLGSLQGKTAKEASFKVQRWVGFRPDTWNRIAPLTRRVIIGEEEKGAESPQAKPAKFVTVEFFPKAGKIFNADSTANAVSPNQDAHLKFQSNCYDELDSLPYYVCEDLIDIWTEFIHPGMRYRAGMEPIWWPKDIPFKRPQCLRKFGMSLSMDHRRRLLTV